MSKSQVEERSQRVLAFILVKYDGPRCLWWSWWEYVLKEERVGILRDQMVGERERKERYQSVCLEFLGKIIMQLSNMGKEWCDRWFGAGGQWLRAWFSTHEDEVEIRIASPAGSWAHAFGGLEWPPLSTLQFPGYPSCLTLIFTSYHHWLSEAQN